MILNNAVNTGSFIYCAAYFSPQEKHNYFNQGNGHYHQYSYIVAGSAIVEITNTVNGSVLRKEEDINSGVLLDLSSTKGQYHNVTTLKDSLSIITFNPIPDTRNLQIEMIKGPINKTITAVDQRITIVCITGPITANNKKLDSMQHAKIFPGKTVELVVSENSVCALVLNEQ